MIPAFVKRDAHEPVNCHGNLFCFMGILSREVAVRLHGCVGQKRDTRCPSVRVWSPTKGGLYSQKQMKMPRNEDIIDDDNDMELEGHISQTVSPQARRTVEYLFCVCENRVPCNFCLIEIAFII